MTRVPFTLRIEREERVALEDLSKVVGRPINQLLNDAIKSYLQQRSPKERSLQANLERLRAYRENDPGFQHAIAQFVEAEVSGGDPLEGEPFEERGNIKGPVQSRIRELLGA
jgi:peptidoglycan hydrolase-like protein with peptidoglycan-binding domain